MNLVQQLRYFAIDAAEASKGVEFPGALAQVFKLAMEQNARAFTAAADHIEAEQKRFAGHLEAWRENNLHHQARIDELEKQLAECKNNLECHERDEL